MANSIDSVDLCKVSAAKRVVEENIKDDCVIGVGSGSTIVFVIEELFEKSKKSGIKIKCIPTSDETEALLRKRGLTITDFSYDPIVDVTIDGADEVDENLVAIKGGGACHALEKVVADAAKKFYVVADYRKDSKNLGQSWHNGIPIEVLPKAKDAVANRICQTFNVPSDQLVLRTKDRLKAVVTDNGNLIIDWKCDFNAMKSYSSSDWRDFTNKVNLIPGVVETGIFAEMITAAYFGQPDGTVIKRVKY